jgi:hypothetical protein
MSVHQNHECVSYLWQKGAHRVATTQIMFIEWGFRAQEPVLLDFCLVQLLLPINLCPEELDGLRSRKLSYFCQSLDGWPKICYLELLCALEGTLSRWFRPHLQSLAPTNLHWTRVVGYGLFSLCVLNKEGLCPSSGDINRLMMMVTMMFETGK